jgi:hypothetical protein
MSDPILVNCPHCQQLIHIEQINCAIFRHAVYRNTYQQMNPHASKEECERAVQDQIILGCGKPFRVQSSEKGLEAVVCDYI